MIPILLTLCLLSDTGIERTVPGNAPGAYAGVIMSVPPGGDRFDCYAPDGTFLILFIGPPTSITWHLDHAVLLPARALRCGTRLRWIVVAGYRASRVEVITLGPLAFEAAVEEFVAQSGGACPVEHRAVLDSLGAPCWQLRQAASQRLRGRPEMLKALIWGRHSPDREVRDRAEGLLYALGWP